MSAPVLCWDIDGTLLSTGRAGVFSLEKAALEITGRPLDLQGMPTAGLTDVEIARLILERSGVDPSEENERRFLRIYEDDLPASLPRRRGAVMPGVREILEALRARPEIGSVLLTGNTRRGAQAKLTHYGLAGFFTEGAFSDGTSNRAEIAERAACLIGSIRPGYSMSQVVVIGDTPHDVACARAVGFRALAVATGSYSIEDLESCRPEAVLPVLPSPSDFLSKIDEVCKAKTG